MSNHQREERHRLDLDNLGRMVRWCEGYDYSLVFIWAFIYLTTSLNYPAAIIFVASFTSTCGHRHFSATFSTTEQLGARVRRAPVDSSCTYNKNDSCDFDPIIINFLWNTNSTFIHQYFMQRALYQAQLASHLYSEVPIGAIVVRNVTTTSTTASTHENVPPSQQEQVYEILSEQHNRVEMCFDASAHAEMLALRDAARNIQNWRLNCNTNLKNSDDAENESCRSSSQTLLYCTLEPCIMCFAAAHAFRIHHLVYGAPDIRLGACGSYVNMIDITASKQHPFHSISNITSGVYANESSSLLRDFFRQRRQQSPQRPPLPLQKRRHLTPSITNMSTASIKETIPFYRQWWKRLVMRFRNKNK